VRVLADSAAKAPEELRIGLGRDMRLTAPELSARYRAGMVAEGAHVLDAGMVGTEMLYFLVGSRALDGGLMCTASHNPKAYTGAKLVRAGAIPLSGEEGIHDIRRAVEGRAWATRRAAALRGGPTSAPSFARPPCASSSPPTSRR
jgi:phosphomannomutase